jgi:hypothetical protein
MSYDITLWKWKKGVQTISPTLCDLLLSEFLPVDCVDKLNAEHLQTAIEKRYPGIPDDEDAEFDFEITDYSISLNIRFSKVEGVLNWFILFAKDNDLYLYNPHDFSDEDSKRDYEDFKKFKEEFYRKFSKEENLPRLEKLAESGNADACLELANLYYFGEAVKKDLTKAFSYYKKSADLGSPEALFNLASCHKNGEGTSKDIHKAIDIYRSLVDKDPIFSGFELGEIFVEGVGVEKDLKQGIQYLRMSADAGNPKASKKLKSLQGIVPPVDKSVSPKGLLNKIFGKRN